MALCILQEDVPITGAGYDYISWSTVPQNKYPWYTCASFHLSAHHPAIISDLLINWKLVWVVWSKSHNIWVSDIMSAGQHIHSKTKHDICSSCSSEPRISTAFVECSLDVNTSLLKIKSYLTWIYICPYLILEFLSTLLKEVCTFAHWYFLHWSV